MVGVRLVVLGHVSLVLSSVRRSPRTGLMRVQTPADSVVFSSVLFGGNISMDLVHSFHDHADMVGFRHGLERRSCRGGVTGQHGSRSSAVDIVSRVAYGTDTREVGRSTTSEDGILNVLPESGLVEQLLGVK